MLFEDVAYSLVRHFVTEIRKLSLDPIVTPRRIFASQPQNKIDYLFLHTWPEVRWNGEDRHTIFVGATEVRVAIPASDVAIPGAAQITVFNPAPAGGLSSTVNFIIN